MQKMKRISRRKKITSSCHTPSTVMEQASNQKEIITAKWRFCLKFVSAIIWVNYSLQSDQLLTHLIGLTAGRVFGSQWNFKSVSCVSDSAQMTWFSYAKYLLSEWEWHWVKGHGLLWKSLSPEQGSRWKVMKNGASIMIDRHPQGFQCGCMRPLAQESCAVSASLLILPCFFFFEKRQECHLL